MKKKDKMVFSYLVWGWHKKVWRCRKKESFFRNSSFCTSFTHWANSLILGQLKHGSIFFPQRFSKPHNTSRVKHYFLGKFDFLIVFPEKCESDTWKIFHFVLSRNVISIDLRNANIFQSVVWVFSLLAGQREKMFDMGADFVNKIQRCGGLKSSSWTGCRWLVQASKVP